MTLFGVWGNFTIVLSLYHEACVLSIPATYATADGIDLDSAAALCYNETTMRKNSSYKKQTNVGSSNVTCPAATDAASRVYRTLSSRKNRNQGPTAGDTLYRTTNATSKSATKAHREKIEIH